MTRTADHRAERGATLIEVMIAGVLLLIGVLGFVGVARFAATATAVAHRRTSLTYFRSALLDRAAVTPRLSFANVAAAGNTGAWMIDSCWDGNSTLLDNNSGLATPGRLGSYTTGFGCPANTLYRSWVQVTPLTALAGNCATTGGCYQLSIYVERSAGSGFRSASDNGCTPASRFSAESCVAADLLYTD
ncbi:MAG TPA: hypothetical protein VFE30_14690 [Anaeromyxobacteraceae bacterium]|jgi:Tfp pilus assembly protein PilV|nr:hypothetical protein [Anaeromyxobacteraceae bacterium]